MTRHRMLTLATLGCCLCMLAPTALAQGIDSLSTPPLSTLYKVQSVDLIDSVAVPPIDLADVQNEDVERELSGLPPRFAIPWGVMITPETDGTWEQVDAKTWIWRLRIVSPEALSLNLGFTRYSMPHNGKLFIYATDYSYATGPYTENDNEEHGELWSPVVLADDIVVEVVVPVESRDALELELTAINHGYRGFGAPDDLRSGSCNNDVVCPIGDDWWSEINSVGVISTGGSTFCTGFMVNNTAQDETPYFMTAYHCGVSSSNAASLVVYWNFQSPNCGDQCCGSLAQNQTGSFFRSRYSTSDFALVELDSAPNPAHNVTYSGWDKSGTNATTAIAIHHPSTDEKAISFEYQSTTTTSYLGNSVPGDGTHERVIDWDDGTTEPGSSGSPLYNQNHQVIGQLHGGYAACGNDDSDWYGKMSRSWTGGGSSANRLSDWLDPLNTGQDTLDTYDPGAAGLGVSPSTAFEPVGDSGGPFTPTSRVYTVENRGDYAVNYSVTKSAAWLAIGNASGVIPANGSANVTVTLTSAAGSLGDGVYEDVVSFVNLTDGIGDTVRAARLQVGGPETVYSWDMNSNPGWPATGSWAYGQPSGSGGEFGGPDPSSGYTGANVYGYNLNGDYDNSMSEYALTTGAIDCSGLSGVTLKFRRWLGVERSQYDHAYVRVNAGGSGWVTIWENGEEITDASWSLQEFDLSAIADGQSDLQVRWVMGTTDGSWRYCGWNIDDVEIEAIVNDTGVFGDLDGDGDIDFDDLNLLLAAYGSSTGGGSFNPDADLDGDGDVDFDDLNALLAVYQG